MKKIFKTLFPLTVLLTMGILIINSQTCAQGFKQGLKLWGLTVLPSALPFLFLSNVLFFTLDMQKVSRKLSKVGKKFGLNGVSVYVFICTLLSGYPVGARLTSSARKEGLLDEKQALKTAVLSSACGSVFIISVVGEQLFSSKKIGFFIYLSHFLSLLISTSIASVFYKSDYNATVIPHKDKKQNLLYDCVFSAIKTALVIGGFITVFSVLIEVMNILKINVAFSKIFSFILDENTAKALFWGLIESSGGVKAISDAGQSALHVALCAFSLSFGGFSVICQSLAFFDENFNKKSFTFFKFLQGILSFCLTLLFFKIF